jgi:hypothetical protein
MSAKIQENSSLKFMLRGLRGLTKNRFTGISVLVLGVIPDFVFADRHFP